MKLFIMPSPPVPRYPVPLRPRYLPQHHSLKQPQPTFLSQYETNFHIHIKQRAKLHLCIFTLLNRKQKHQYYGPSGSRKSLNSICS